MSSSSSSNGEGSTNVFKIALGAVAGAATAVLALNFLSSKKAAPGGGRQGSSKLTAAEAQANDDESEAGDQVAPLNKTPKAQARQAILRRQSAIDLQQLSQETIYSNKGEHWILQPQAMSERDWQALKEVENAKFARVFKNNLRWVEKMLSEDADYFKKLAAAPQQPTYLFIGCSDSRVPANIITGIEQGDMFVHRNIANLVVNTDLNCLSVMQYAVEVLGVRHIMVTGHYQCGGVLASMGSKDFGLIENWLRNIRDVQRLHSEELAAIEDDKKRWNRLVELNVQEQCLNVFKCSIVQKARARTGGRFPRVHGLCYDIAEGILHELPVDYSGYQTKYQHVYGLDS